MNRISYCFAFNLHEYELTLEDTALRLVCDGRSSLHPYSEIAQVQMRKSSAGYLTTLRLLNGNKIEIPSRSFKPLFHITDKNENYSTFVVDLHARILKIDGISFEQGNSPLVHYGFPIGCLFLLFLLFSFSLVEPLEPYSLMIKIAGLGVLAALIVWIVKHPPLSRIRKYDPSDIPSRLLPNT